jgi:hypothetical protein
LILAINVSAIAFSLAFFLAATNRAAQLASPS